MKARSKGCKRCAADALWAAGGCRVKLAHAARCHDFGDFDMTRGLA